MTDKNVAEIQTISELALILTISVFSVVLIVLDILLSWEKWMIPLVLAAMLGCVATYVLGLFSFKAACYIYGIILIVEVFYYTVKAKTVYDCTAVIILMLVILAMTQYQALTWLGFASSYIGVLYGLGSRSSGGLLRLGLSHIVRTGWHIVLLFVAVFVVEQLMASISRIERQLNKRIATLEEENQAASDFLTNVSHEIRTPVNVIVGMSQLAIEDEPEQTQKERLSDIFDAGNRVSEQISDIMDYSEIDMNRIAVNEEDYMISSVVTDEAAIISRQMKKGVEVIMDVDPTLPAVMHSDVAKIKKILFHLISNGIKFTNEGGVYIKIGYEKQAYGINLIITVTDTGIGMEMEDERAIFRRFYQGDSRRTRSSGGLGLGLPIVVGFLRALGGFIYIDSTPQGGTTIRASIPQKVVDEGPCADIRDKNNVCIGAFFYFGKISNPQVREFYNSLLDNLATMTQTISHRADNIDNLKRLVRTVRFTHLFVGANEYNQYTDYLERLTSRMTVIVIADDGLVLKPQTRVRVVPKPVNCISIINVINHTVREKREAGELRLYGVKALVVDDEPMNLTVARGILGRYGMEVVTAESGLEAVGLCAKEDFDIVFMDHMMPEMDGVEAMKRIRAEARRREADYPVVALTANALSSAREMFLAEGFDGFVSKPIELIDLERVLRKLLPKAIVNVAVPEKREKTFAEELAELGFDYSRGMHYSQGDEGFYRTLLGQFADEAGAKQERAAAMLSQKDAVEYAVVVHSIKSTAKMLGADALSEEAKELEYEAKAGQMDLVAGAHPDFFARYRKTAKKLKTLLGDEGKPAGQVMPANGKVFEFLPKEG